MQHRPGALPQSSALIGEGERAEVDRLLALGATRTDTGRDDVDRVELADPDGDEFCVVPPRQPVPVV